MARDEARRQFAIALKLFPSTVKEKISRLNEVATKVRLPQTRSVLAQRSRQVWILNHAEI